MGWQAITYGSSIGPHRCGDPEPQSQTNSATQRAAGVNLAA